MNVTERLGSHLLATTSTMYVQQVLSCQALCTGQHEPVARCQRPPCRPPGWRTRRPNLPPPICRQATHDQDISQYTWRDHARNIAQCSMHIHKKENLPVSASPGRAEWPAARWLAGAQPAQAGVHCGVAVALALAVAAEGGTAAWLAGMLHTLLAQPLSTLRWQSDVTLTLSNLVLYDRHAACLVIVRDTLAGAPHALPSSGCSVCAGNQDLPASRYLRQ